MASILVVDDSLAERNNLETILSGAGYQVLTASDGNQVIDIVKTHRPNLVLLDVNMPGMDGFATARTLKNEEEVKDTPIVFVTSKDQKADKAWGQMLGAKGYITKPYTAEQVIAQVGAVV